MRFVLRIAAIVGVLLVIPFVGAALIPRGGALLGVSASLALMLWTWLWAPRTAHAVFDAGRFALAARRYRWLERLAPSATRERAARLSRVACAVALGDGEAAGALLATIDVSSLAAAERAVYLNNQACAQLAAGAEPSSVLAIADEANALRPDVPALQHTRAMVLIALGRLDEAIVILDGMRSGGELPKRLEADRCRELARAWEQKGQAAYADDYRGRAASYTA